MLSTEFILILIALVLVSFEVILPGGILGVIAAVCVIIATALAYMEHGLWAASGLFFGSLVLIAALVYLEFKLLAKTTLGKAFFLKDAVTGHSGPVGVAEDLIGKTGKALTRLNPSGKVLVEGITYEASSQDGYIDADQAVTVVSQNNFKLIIKKT